MKYFIVSDVHGYYDELLKALNSAGFDINNHEHIFVSLGDLLDRGKQPKECLNFVNSLPDTRKILIRGNHEDLMEEMISRGYHNWCDIHNGTLQTAHDLIGKTDYEDCIRDMRNNKDYNKYISSTIDYWETNTAIFVHGWIPCYIWGYYNASKRYGPIENWQNEISDFAPYRWVCGIDAWHDGVIEKGKVIYCGHWHSSYGNSKYHHDGSEFGEDANFAPFIDDGICACDSCVHYSGKINCVVLEEI